MVVAAERGTHWCSAGTVVRCVRGSLQLNETASADVLAQFVYSGQADSCQANLTCLANEETPVAASYTTSQGAILARSTRDWIASFR
jgi:hypothetical protein